MKSILDPSFVYTKSGETDLRKTFRRVRAQIAAPQAGNSIGPSRHSPEKETGATPAAAATDETERGSHV